MFKTRTILLALVFVIFICITGLKSYAATLTVTSTADQPDPPRLTLREAIAQAQPGDTIDFHSSLDGQRIILTTAPLEIHKNLTITAASLLNGIIVDRNRMTGWVIGIWPSYTVQLNHLTITGAGTDAGLASAGDVTVTNCQIVDNQSTGQYGGISINREGRLTLNKTVVLRNRGAQAAVGIEGSVVMRNCTFSDNNAAVTLYLYQFGNDSRVSISGSSFFNNSGTAFKRLSYANPPASRIVINDCTFSQNRNGGISNEGGPIEIRRCKIVNNNATTDCGGIWHRGGQMIVENSRILANTGGTAGGISIQGSYNNLNTNVEINRCTISHNRGTTAGIYIGNSSNNSISTTLNECTISNNISNEQSGVGGILCSNESSNATFTVELNNSTISGNSSSSSFGTYAGGLAIIGFGAASMISATVNNCTISGNRSNNGPGGGITLGAPQTSLQFRLVASTITDNEARIQGGGVFVNPSPTVRTEIHNSLIALNRDLSERAPDISASVVSQGYNLIGKVDGSSGWLDTDQTGDISNPLDPVLGALANNGGPTMTHALLKGSPAINTGDPVLFGTRDQRGVTRDKYPDIGSYEVK